MKRPNLIFTVLFAVLLLVFSVQGQINLENKKENFDERPAVDNSESAKGSLASSLALGLTERFLSSSNDLSGISILFKDSPKTYQLRFWNKSLKKRVGLGPFVLEKYNTRHDDKFSGFSNFYNFEFDRPCDIDDAQLLVTMQELKGKKQMVQKIVPPTGEPDVLSFSFGATGGGEFQMRFWNKSLKKYVGLGRCKLGDLPNDMLHFECQNDPEFDEIELHRTFPLTKTCSFLSDDYGKTEEGTPGEPQLSVSVEDPRDVKTTTLLIDPGRIDLEEFEKVQRKFRFFFWFAKRMEPLDITSTLKIHGLSEDYPYGVTRKTLRINGVLQKVRCVRIDHGFEWNISQNVTHARLHLVSVRQSEPIDIAVFNGKDMVRDIKFIELEKLVQEAKVQLKRRATNGHFYLHLSCEKECQFDRVVITLHNPDAYIRGAEFTVATIRKPVDWVKRKSDNL